MEVPFSGQLLSVSEDFSNSFLVLIGDPFHLNGDALRLSPASYKDNQISVVLIAGRIAMFIIDFAIKSVYCKCSPNQVGVHPLIIGKPYPPSISGESSSSGQAVHHLLL
jgi:hypothetical protein